MTPYHEVLDHYKILKLDCEEFPKRAPLGPGYEYADEIEEHVAEELLRPEFPGWRRPVSGALPGFREDSVVAVRHEGETVAVCYVCADNQLGLRGYGELHFAAVRPDHRGQGLWHAMITELFARAQSWNLAGVMFVTDRRGPIEMYRRLGAREIGIRPKEKPPSFWRRAPRRLARAIGID